MSVEAERNFVEHMRWDEVARRIARGDAAILPIGAAAKQHGVMWMRLLTRDGHANEAA